ncbi:MAG: amidohydrolase family protein [Kiritimatiellae bacterium]|nr:amidohydrolase family protein [Kiritimatiellia bacterium]MBO7298720.1 amidohydrolase family protein [Kiritimatiellia bacterium]
MAKDTVIDSHIHIMGWYDKFGNYFIDGLEYYRNKFGLKAINLAALPAGDMNVSNNIIQAVYKHVNKNTFAHGGVTYHKYPVPDQMPEGMDLVTQYHELMEIGFDGIKMLEGKPSHHKMIGRDMSDSFYDPFFAELEKDQTHLIFHVNDPEQYWDKNNPAVDDLRSRGWFYGDGDYASYDEVVRQTFAILEHHPNLCVNFAHFLFFSGCPEKLEEAFAKYPNMGVDITPGGEMYLGFDARFEYYKEFFTKYSERIQFGTDITPGSHESQEWLYDRVYRYIATEEKFQGFANRIHTGMNLPQEAKDNILYKNFERTVGETPKPINTAALLKYIEKYRCLMPEKDAIEVDKVVKTYL